MNANHDPLAHLATKEALAAVSARLEATLPHLATKADVERVSNRLLFWLTGTLVTCLLTFYGLHTNLMAAQQEQIRELRAEMQANTREQQRLTAEQERIVALLEQIAAQRTPSPRP